MNKIRFLITIILTACIFNLTYAEKRAMPLPMKVLTDPDSPSYVPYPYPKNDKEIIEDMKYAIKKFYLPKEGRKEIILGDLPQSRMILPDLLSDSPSYKLGKIVKVKNFLSKCPDDYYWLIPLLNENESKAAVVMISANGLWGGTSSGFPSDKPVFIKSEDDILCDLSMILGIKITKKELTHIQAMEMPPHIGRLFVPAYEIKLNNGSVFYYSSGKNEFYYVKKELPWRKNNKGFRPNQYELGLKSETFSIDEINDKILVFEKLEKKK